MNGQFGDFFVSAGEVIVVWILFSVYITCTIPHFLCYVVIGLCIYYVSISLFS